MHGAILCRLSLNVIVVQTDELMTIGCSWRARCEAPTASHLRRSCTSTTRPAVLHKLVRHMAPPGHGKPDDCRKRECHALISTGVTGIRHKGWHRHPAPVSILFKQTVAALAKPMNMSRSWPSGCTEPMPQPALSPLAVGETRGSRSTGRGAPAPMMTESVQLFLQARAALPSKVVWVSSRVECLRRAECG